MTKIILCLSIGAGLLCSCTQAEPRIPFGTMQALYFEGEKGPEERLSFFIIAEDDDGAGNLAELYLFHDRQELQWLFTAENWISVENQNRTWIGSRAIVSYNGSSLPRGQYRALLRNKSGAEVEHTFTFDAPNSPRFSFPRFTIHDEIYTIISQYPAHYFLCYDESGNLLKTIPVEEKEGTVAGLALPSAGRTLALWAEDRDYATSALTNPQAKN
ncbi:hypothetical protein FACS1894164_18090 [Spirochaetia bacterium]|nr:hypothetical protein FACS1894164_18090 [Spirochaetia bacterium]